MSLHRPQFALLLPCVLVVVAHALAWTPWGRTRLWGLHHGAYLPVAATAALTLLVVAALLPPVARRLSGAALTAAEGLRRILPGLPGVIVVVAGVALFAAFPVEHGLLGDADARLSDVSRRDLPGLGVRPHERDTIVRQLLHRYVGLGLGLTVQQSYAAISTAWGAALLAGGWWFAGRLAGAGTGRLLLVGPLATSGYVLLFFGYIETYSSVAALGVLLLSACSLYVRSAVRLWLPLLAWAVLTLHHLLGVAAGAAVVIAFLRRRGLVEGLPSRLRQRPGLVVALLTWLLCWVAFLVVRPTSAVPLIWAYEHIPYRLLGPEHLADIANFGLLSALPAAVALAAAALSPRGPVPPARTSPPELEILTSAALATALLTFIANPALGRLDWDLMAMHAPLWVLAACAWLWWRLRDDEGALRVAAAVLTSVSLFHTAPWVALQQAPDRIARAVVDMVEDDPHRAGSRMLKLGVRLDNLGHPELALHQYRKAIEWDPSAGLAHYNYGRMLDLKGSLDEARHHYVEAVRLDPGLPRAWNNLGAVHLRQNRPAEAAEALERAVALEDSYAAAWNNLGTAYYDLERFAPAARAFTRAAELGADLPTLYFNMGVCYARLGRYAAAASSLERFVVREPRAAPGFLQLGDAYARLGDRERAGGALRRFLQLAAADDPVRPRVEAYLRQIGGEAP